MPPSVGIVPPLSPVPAPRPTRARLKLPGDLYDGDDILGGGGKDDAFGTALLDAAVIFVKHQILGPFEQTTRADDLAQSRQRFGRNHT